MRFVAHALHGVCAFGSVCIADVALFFWSAYVTETVRIFQHAHTHTRTRTHAHRIQELNHLIGQKSVADMPQNPATTSPDAEGNVPASESTAHDALSGTKAGDAGERAGGETTTTANTTSAHPHLEATSAVNGGRDGAQALPTAFNGSSHEPHLVATSTGEVADPSLKPPIGAAGAAGNGVAPASSSSSSSTVPGASMSAAPGSVKPKKVTGLRRGKWTTEEENYANRLIQEFKAGLLPLTDGTTLRTFLSKLLNCDPMRISKKFVGSNCIGKQVFRRRQQDMDRLTAEDIEQSRRELSELERRFLERVAQNSRCKSAAIGGKGDIIRPSQGSMFPPSQMVAPWMVPPQQQPPGQGSGPDM